MKNTYQILALVMIALLGISTVFAFGFKNNLWNQDLTDEEIEQEREAIQQAVENNDFDSWKSLMEERISKMQESLTLENFNNIKEKHEERETFKLKIQEARESGDFELIQSLKEKYGIENKGHFKNKGNFRNQNLNGYLNKENCQFNIN
jgi:hypothetical protein